MYTTTREPSLLIANCPGPKEAPPRIQVEEFTRYNWKERGSGLLRSELAEMKPKRNVPQLASDVSSIETATRKESY